MACSGCRFIQCVVQPYFCPGASRRCESSDCHQHSALHRAQKCNQKLKLLRSNNTDSAAAHMGTFSSTTKLMACEQHRSGCPKSPTSPSKASDLTVLASTGTFAAILGVTASTRADTLDPASPSSLLSTDGAIGIAFTVAVLALGALTLGVLYLTISSWLDNRAEKAEREKFEKAFRERDTSATREEDTKMAVQKKRKGRDYVSKGGGKGFGR